MTDAPADTTPVPAEVEQAIRRLADDPDKTGAALSLAAIANRATAALNSLARSEANARRGQEDWGSWASLANAARDAVLKLAATRRVATDLAKRAATPGASPPPAPSPPPSSGGPPDTPPPP